MQRVAVLILVACCAFTALSLAEETNKSKPASSMSSAEAFDTSSHFTTSNPIPTTKSTTPKPTTKHTTPKPTTLKPTTKHTTPKPTTPKPTTNSTTPKPTTNSTTPKPTTNSTTPKPTTNSTTPKPTTPKPTTTTAPKPTPATNMTVGNYTLKTEKGETCLKAQMALQIRLTTPKADGRFIVQPQKTKTSGTCMDTKVNLNISFEEGFITFSFIKSVENNTVYVHAVSFQLSYPLTQTGPQNYKVNNESMHLFAVKIGHSYSCRNESVNMGQGLFLDISKDRMQAFNITKDTFGYSDPCPADQPDYRVAIAVGVTLLVLIVIVVIVYLLGRRRRTAGYQSL